ncbi:MAG: hypothetical protein HC894_31655 [Microcoleus sp. SM1_3_4]|nr:hypothetical protein [Microcoleus sp. SM1_3_4]
MPETAHQTIAETVTLPAPETTSPQQATASKISLPALETVKVDRVSSQTNYSIAPEVAVPPRSTVETEILPVLETRKKLQPNGKIDAARFKKSGSNRYYDSGFSSAIRFGFGFSTVQAFRSGC